LSSTFQLAFNELEVQRVKYVSRLRERQARPSPAEPSPPPSTEPPALPLDVAFWRWLGVKKITPEEHLVKLRGERDLVWVEIQRLEREEADKPAQGEGTQP
jgi:hypothetical protein